MNLLPDEQLSINNPFQSTKSRKKELCVENKVRETIGDVYCPTCRNENCVFFSTKKMKNFHDCKKCKGCCHVLKIPFGDQKPTIMLFGCDGTDCLNESPLRKTISIFEEISPPITVTRTKKRLN